jgi:hypothetical protein
MHDPVLIAIPYWYDAKVVRQRCRVEDVAVLRTTVPYHMPHLTRAEASPVLTVKIVYGQHRRNAPFELTWLSDGVSYLRPLHVRLGDAPRDFDYTSSGTPMTLEYFQAILSFQPGVDFCRHEFPQRWMFERNPKLHGIKFKGKRVDHVDPRVVDTPAEYGAIVKQWVSSDEDAGAAEALRDAQRYVLVEDVVHRRVPVPFWTFSGVPSLVHGETLDGRDAALLWPISLTADFDHFIAAQPDQRYTLEAEAEYHQPADVKADLARLGSLVLAGLWKHILQAAPHLSDDDLDRYKRLRLLSKTAAGTFDDCARAMVTLEAMLADRGWDAAKKYPSDNIRRPVAGHVRHWKRLLHAAGTPILDETEDEALASLAG